MQMERQIDGQIDRDIQVDAIEWKWTIDVEQTLNTCKTMIFDFYEMFQMIFVQKVNK